MMTTNVYIVGMWIDDSVEAAFLVCKNLSVYAVYAKAIWLFHQGNSRWRWSDGTHLFSSLVQVYTFKFGLKRIICWHFGQDLSFFLIQKVTRQEQTKNVPVYWSYQHKNFTIHLPRWSLNIIWNFAWVCSTDNLKAL